MSKIFSLSALFFILLLAGCSKKEQFYDTVGKGAYLTFVSVSNTLDPSAPTNKVTMVVNKTGAAVKSVNLYVSTSPTLDKSKWKLVKNVPFNGETTLTATVAEIATALGINSSTIAPGTVYTMYNEAVLEDGRMFSMANTNSPDLEAQPAFNLAMRWQAVVVCPAFNLADHYNNVVYEVVREDWEDLFPGDEVLIKLGPGNDEITLVDFYPTPYDHKDMVVKIDKSNGKASVARYTYGGYSPSGTRYTAATAGAFNFVFPCTGIIDLTINHSTTGGSNQGNYRVILKKK